MSMRGIHLTVVKRVGKAMGDKAIHLSHSFMNGRSTVCGKPSDKLTTTIAHALVTCKLCLRTMAYVRARPGTVRHEWMFGRDAGGSEQRLFTRKDRTMFNSNALAMEDLHSYCRTFPVHEPKSLWFSWFPIDHSCKHIIPRWMTRQPYWAFFGMGRN